MKISENLGDETDMNFGTSDENVGKIHHPQVATFITARTGSSRLPGKPLLQIMGKPIIEHLIERVKRAKLPQRIVLCTTVLPEDDPLKQIATRTGILTFRGHPTDILMRWLKAAEHYQVDFIVSADGDDVFCDPEHIDKIVEHFLKTNADYITCRGLPFGATPTGIKVEALRKICELKLDEDTEGQSRYFTQTGLFRVEYLDITDPELNHPEIRMTLDYLEDFEFFKAVFQHLYKPEKAFGLQEIIKLLEQHPGIVKINQHMQEKYEERFQAKYGEVKLKKQP
jgi:spore coat polysaccharide biosynthesis protein SpsF